MLTIAETRVHAWMDGIWVSITGFAEGAAPTDRPSFLGFDALPNNTSSISGNMGAWYDAAAQGIAFVTNIFIAPLGYFGDPNRVPLTLTGPLEGSMSVGSWSASFSASQTVNASDLQVSGVQTSVGTLLIYQRYDPFGVGFIGSDFILPGTGPDLEIREIGVRVPGSTEFMTVDDGGLGIRIAYEFLYSSQRIPNGNFQIGDDSRVPIVCFVKGSLLATPTGSVAVEDVRPGDILLTFDGRSLPVRWVGYRAVDLKGGLHLDAPIRISSGSLGPELPKRDLYLSPHHAVLVDGLLVNASALVDRLGVSQVFDFGSHVEYFHIELDEHVLLVSEGLPAESFLATTAAMSFDNAADRPSMLAPEAMRIRRIKSKRQLLAARLTAKSASGVSNSGSLVAA